MMILTKTAIAVLTLVLAAVASPASARSRAAHPGYDARAQAIGDGNGMSISAVRAKALEECNQEASKFVDYNWGITELDRYRVCMAERGQPE
jgi:hypothetical protein